MSYRCCSALVILLAACSGSSDVPGFSRTVAPDGHEIVSYAAGLPAEEDTIVPLFTIGKYVDDSSQIFGDLRGVEADTAGRIFVLDYLNKEITIFDREGNRLKRLSGPGEGPGEISRANGLRFGPDGTLWINDHGKRMILAIDPDGTERERRMGLVPGFAYRWGVTIDTAGVLWEPWSRTVSRSGGGMEESGVREGTSIQMYMNLDPAADTRDSVELGEAKWTSYVQSYNGGKGQMGMVIPFAGRAMSVMDRHRRIWTTVPDSYLLTRRAVTGDTTLEVRVAEAGLPVTAEDKAEWKAGWDNRENFPASFFDNVMALMPPTKALMVSISTDDRDRLWLGRTVPAGERARWDVFDPDGTFLATFRGPEGVATGLEPVVRGNRIYMIGVGEAGERYLVVGEVGVPPGSVMTTVTSAMEAP